MGVFDKLFRRSTTDSQSEKIAFWLNDPDAGDYLIPKGYISLEQSPEVLACVDVITSAISSMTIYLMQNTSKGDKRLTNALSRKIDIEPNRYMNRANLMRIVTQEMLLYGNAILLPVTKEGLIDELVYVPHGYWSFVEISPYRYMIQVQTDKEQYKVYDPSDVLHFVYNPDPRKPYMGRGLQVPLKDLVGKLNQASETEKAFLQSKWKPSLIVKIDALQKDMKDPEFRQAILDNYVKSADAGEPWLLPASQFQVEQVKPLSLQDLAINDNVELDRTMLAALFGVPKSELGIGSFSSAEWNKFVRSRVLSIAKIIEQEMTRKLIVSDKWYLMFNIESLYSYDLKEITDIYGQNYDRGLVTGNEMRQKLSLPPRDECEGFYILNNYVQNESNIQGKQNKAKSDDGRPPESDSEKEGETDGDKTGSD